MRVQKNVSNIMTFIVSKVCNFTADFVIVNIILKNFNSGHNILVVCGVLMHFWLVAGKTGIDIIDFADKLPHEFPNDSRFRILRN